VACFLRGPHHLANAALQSLGALVTVMEAAEHQVLIAADLSD